MRSALAATRRCAKGHVLGMAAHSVAEALDLLAEVREQSARNHLRSRVFAGEDGW